MNLRHHQNRILAVIAVVLAVTAVVLFLRLPDADGDTHGADQLEPGDVRSLEIMPFAIAHIVELPHLTAELRVGAPVEAVPGPYVGEEAPGLHAAGDGALVPIAWNVTALYAAPDIPDSPVEVRLRVGDQQVTVGSKTKEDIGRGSTSHVVALADAPSLQDLAVEVEFDGHTQTLHVASGEIDAGVAQALYEPEHPLGAECALVSDYCPMPPVDAASPVQPADTNYDAEPVRLIPYDPVAGWAEEDHLWAKVEVKTYARDGRDASGEYVVVLSAKRARVFLDGRLPAEIERERTDRGSRAITALFEVSADTPPTTLRIVVDLHFEGGTVVPVEAEVPLRDAD